MGSEALKGESNKKSKDEFYMERVIALANKGRGCTNPNPLVGAIIVKNNKILGKGYHKYYGSYHAEIEAFKDAELKGEDVEGATLYVNLEPCSHYGKTPPCAKAIIEKKIKKVVVGIKDPNPIVSGRGIRFLEENGIEVKVGVLGDRCTELNKIFVKHITTGLPYVILKWAMTLDGKIATSNGDSKWITGEDSRTYVHKLRSSVSGIMVGVNTVIKDDPSLNVRLCSGKSPIPIILDTHCRIPLHSKVLNGEVKPIIYTSEKAESDKVSVLQAMGVDVIVGPIKNGKMDTEFLMKSLGSMNINSILIEGGGEVAYSFLEGKLVDEVLAFISPKIIGGINSKTPVGGGGIEFIKDCINLESLKIRKFEKDILIRGKIQK